MSYNLTEVVTARRAAGLKVNLGDENTAQQGTQTRAVSTLVTANLTKESNSSVTENISSWSSVEIVGGTSNNTEDKQRKMKSGVQLSRLVNKKLAEAKQVTISFVGFWFSFRVTASAVKTPRFAGVFSRLKA